MIGRATMRIFQFSRSDESNIKPLSLSLSMAKFLRETYVATYATEGGEGRVSKKSVCRATLVISEPH